MKNTSPARRSQKPSGYAGGGQLSQPLFMMEVTVMTVPKKVSSRQRRENRWAYLMLSPFLIFFVLFVLYPLLKNF